MIDCKTMRNQWEEEKTLQYSIKRFLDVQIFKILLSSYVLSITDYAITVWGFSQATFHKLQQKINQSIFSYFQHSLFGKTHKRQRKARVSRCNSEVNTYHQNLDLMTISERRLFLPKFYKF